MHPLSQRFRMIDRLIQADNTTPYCAELLTTAANELDRLYLKVSEICPDLAALTLENETLRARALDLTWQIENYEPTLRLIACGPRSDGTYNHCRASCRVLAEKALHND